jgi:hypothetical protein
MSIVRTLSWVLVGSLACGAAGCSGSVVTGSASDSGTGSDTSVATDTGGTTDTGSVTDAGSSVDTGSTIDTGSIDDTGSTTDVGSIFDVDLPDISLGDGATVGGCYACLETSCTSQLAACNADPKCAALVTCALACSASAGNACLTGCYTSSGAASDPTILTTGGNILKCDQAHCTTACPAGTALPADAAAGD